MNEFDMFDESHCGMCSAPMAPGEGVEIEPGGPLVCGECAGEYEGMQPVAYTEGSIKESTEFDKFMDRIVLDEGKKQLVDKPEDNPQRRRAARYQDRPMNKTRVGGR